MDVVGELRHGSRPARLRQPHDRLGRRVVGASPKTAGVCALLAQWWRRWHAGRNPSPAMLRALVVNGAEPIASGGPVPNQLQGWGRLSLRELLDPEVARLALDQADLLVGPGTPGSGRCGWRIPGARSRSPSRGRIRRVRWAPGRRRRTPWSTGWRCG
ncbi:hypothetical protein ACFQ60_38580 [Streptomyces zhihengii]